MCNKGTLATRWFWLIIKAKLSANWQTDKLTSVFANECGRQKDTTNWQLPLCAQCADVCVGVSVGANGILSACVCVCECVLACLWCCGIQPGGHTLVQANVLCGFIIAIEMKNKYFNYRANTQSRERNKECGRGVRGKDRGRGRGRVWAIQIDNTTNTKIQLIC